MKDSQTLRGEKVSNDFTPHKSKLIKRSKVKSYITYS